jgi:hypothetical protein
MKVNVADLLAAIDGEIVTNTTPEELNITGGYVSDLLSDVMGNAREGDLWITIMRHLNVVAVASLTGVAAIVFAKGIVPAEAVITKANDEGICLITSNKETFDTAGIVYALLHA